MRKWISAVVAGLLMLNAAGAIAERKVSLGAGFFGAGNTDCTDCSFSGAFAVLAYSFNRLAELEAKVGSGSSDNGTDKPDLTLAYLGANVGWDFNTDWFKLYGKLGIGRIEETATDSSPDYSTTSVTGGVGTRFILSEGGDGLYVKLEALGVGFQNDSAGVALIAGLG